VISCDLCGKPANCFQKEIDGKEFDLCCSCWTALKEKLSGKGRPKGSLGELEEAKLEDYDEISTY